MKKLILVSLALVTMGLTYSCTDDKDNEEATEFINKRRLGSDKDEEPER